MRSRRFLVIRASCTANLVTTDSISFELSRGRYTTKQKDVAFDLVSGLVWVKSACLCALVCDQYHLLYITIWSDCCKKTRARVCVRWPVPGEPRRLRLEAVNSTSVLVEWRPPAEAQRRGLIRGYQVLYSPTTATNRSSPASEASPRAGTRVIDVVDPGTWQAAVTGLLASTAYQFQVAAVGRKGIGQRSRPRRVVTKGHGPCL